MKKVIVLTISILLCCIAYTQNVGIGTVSPTDKLHINSATGQDPLRVQINGSTKLRVNDNGGTSIGTLTVPSANGLIVAGSIQPQSGIATNNKLNLESTGDSIIVMAGGSQIILASNGNITIKATTGKIVIDAGSLDLELKGSNIKILATSTLTMNGSQIKLNGGTRPASGIGHLISGSSIISGSSTVLID